MQRQTPLTWLWGSEHLLAQLDSWGQDWLLPWGSARHSKQPFPASAVGVCPRSVIFPVPFLPTVAAGYQEHLCSGLVNWRFSGLIDSNAGEHLFTPAAASQTAVNCRHERDNNYGIMGGFCVSRPPFTVSANTEGLFPNTKLPCRGDATALLTHPCHPAHLPQPPPGVLPTFPG